MGRFSLTISDSFSRLTKETEKHANESSLIGNSAELLYSLLYLQIASAHLSLRECKPAGVIRPSAASRGCVSSAFRRHLHAFQKSTFDQTNTIIWGFFGCHVADYVSTTTSDLF